MRRAGAVWAIVAALALASCGAKTPATKGAGGELHIYNWTDYIDPALLKQFTAETGIKVVYDTFDSNEVLETKVLQGGTGYDIVVPSNHNLPRYITAGALARLDKSQLPGLDRLTADARQHLNAFDPGGVHAAPYMQGTIGIGYNVKALAKRLPDVPIDSWDVVFKPENLARLKDCGVYFLDASEDMFAVVLNDMGRDPNSTNLADYHDATALLMKARPYVRKFHSSEYIDALANGDICVAVGYSGDVLQAKDRAVEAKNHVEIAYVVPKEGSQVWYDLFVIPKDAPNPAAAHKFIAFMLRPEIIARASNSTRYANANADALALVAPEVRDDPNVYPTPEMSKRLFVTTTKDQALLREVNRQWTRVLTGK